MDANRVAMIRRMIDSIMVGVWFVSADGKTSVVNQQMARTLGLSPEEAAHVSVIDFVVEEDRVRVNPGLTGQKALRFRRKDGSVGWGIFDSSPLADAHGHTEGTLTVMTDVTAQREAELRFSRLFDSGIIGVTVADVSGLITEANDTFLKIVGYTREDLQAGVVSWIDMTPPEWRDASPAIDRLRVGNVHPFENEYLRKDGTRVAVLIGDATLDERRFLTIVTDLSARKLAEDRKAAVVDTALDAVVGLDHLGAVTEWNPAAEQTFQYPRAETLGRKLVDLIIPQQLRAAHVAGLERYLATGNARILNKRVELTALRRDGVEIPVELTVSRVGSGETPSFVGFIRDISERRRVETALVENLRVAALAADVGIALTASESLDDILQQCCQEVVRHLGAAFARIWTLNAATNVLDLKASAGKYTHIDGPHAHVPVGKYKIGLIAEERLPHLTNDVQNDPRVGDPEWARREGMRSFAGHPLLVGDQLVGVMAMFAREPLTDCTIDALARIADAIAVRIRVKHADQMNVALEEQLRQAQKMEAVGRLAGGVAHDFNNLLSVILSYTELLIEDLQPGDPIQESIDEIHRAGVRATELTRQLLMFSRQQVIAPRVLDLNVVLSGMEKMLRRLVGEDIELTSNLGAANGSVRVDPGSLEQVIMNLVINARDAMPKGGNLTMATANVVHDEEHVRNHFGAKLGAHVKLSVTDTGTGMTRGTLARIFEPFFTTKDKAKGTGLGLSTVLGIVQQSGGTIWVESEPGRGTTVTVHLPEIDATAEDPPSQRLPATLRGSETILLVEDEDQVRDVARGILRRYGYTVIETRNAGEALLVCEGHAGTIDLLLTDVVMPWMGGPELAKRLAKLRPEMKVLFMSGYTDDATVRHGLIAAELAYLQKPLTVETLTKKVREVLERKREG